MKIAGLRYLNCLPNYNITSEISSYMKGSINKEISAVKYHYTRIFEALEKNNIQIDNEVMYKFGITEIGNTPQEGIRLIGQDYNHIVSFPKPNMLKLTYLDKISGDAKKIIHIQDNNFYEQSKIKRRGDFEDSLEELLDNISNTLFDFNRKISVMPPQPYIPNSNEAKKLSEINRKLNVSKVHPAIMDMVRLSGDELKLSQNVLEKYNSIKKLCKNFNNSRTQNNVRNYYKNYDSTQSNLNTMMFKNIGMNGEDIGIGVFTYNGNSCTMINVRPKGSLPFAFVITQDGKVQKNLPYQTVRTQFAKKRHDAIPEYYTQAELEKLNMKQYLECADNELKKFEEHIINSQKRQADFLQTHNNDNIASLTEQMPRINRLFKSIEGLKTNIKNQFGSLIDAEKILLKNNMDVEFSRRGLRLGKVTPEGYDIRLTYPSVLGQRATQILVMDGEEIKKSFYIIDEKLLKFDIKKVSDAFTHGTRQRYYHSQEYIDNSGMFDYIGIIEKNLKKANSIIKQEN